jgi:hypothetical protein
MIQTLSFVRTFPLYLMNNKNNTKNSFRDFFNRFFSSNKKKYILVFSKPFKCLPEYERKCCAILLVKLKRINHALAPDELLYSFKQSSDCIFVNSQHGKVVRGQLSYIIFYVGAFVAHSLKTIVSMRTSSST